MRNCFVLTAILFCIATNCLAQKSPMKIYGTVMIDSNTAMKTTEVTLEEWICFIISNNFDPSLFPDGTAIPTSAKMIFEDLRRKRDFEYLIIDENVGTMRKNFGKTKIVMTKSFDRLCDLDSNYFSVRIPVTGISYQQALKYCKWKEELINASQSKKVQVTLPGIENYMAVIPNKDSIDKEKCYQYNCLSAKGICNRSTKENKSQGAGLLRIDAYWPSSLGIYNLQGNAAEMTSTEGVAMGGSYRHFARQSYKDAKLHYSKPEAWLGFRYIVTPQ